MSLIYHIDAMRFGRVRSQGYQLLNVPRAAYRWGESQRDVIYHLITGEHAFCDECRKEVESLKAETPIQLEREKLEHAA